MLRIGPAPLTHCVAAGLVVASETTHHSLRVRMNGEKLNRISGLIADPWVFLHPPPDLCSRGDLVTRLGRWHGTKEMTCRVD